MLEEKRTTDDKNTNGSTMYYRAYGLVWQSDVALALFEQLPEAVSQPDIRVTVCSTGTVPSRKVLIDGGKVLTFADGLRYLEDDIASMETVGTDQIVVYPGPGWAGFLPHSFFSTVTGALLALRGGLTIHGSAVEVEGRAIILCGPSGAGKSTHLAALVANGAKLISDDLTVIEPLKRGVPPSLFPGRRCIRLFSRAAAILKRSVPTETLPADGAKELIVPPRSDNGRAVPLAGFILLESSQHPEDGEGPRKVKLTELWFKPNINKHLGGHILRELALRALLKNTRFVHSPAISYSATIDVESLSGTVLNSWQAGNLPVQFL